MTICGWIIVPFSSCPNLCPIMLRKAKTPIKSLSPPFHFLYCPTIFPTTFKKRVKKLNLTFPFCSRLIKWFDFINMLMVCHTIAGNSITRDFFSFLWTPFGCFLLSVSGLYVCFYQAKCFFILLLYVCENKKQTINWCIYDNW